LDELTQSSGESQSFKDVYLLVIKLVGVGVLAVLTICSPCVAFGGLYCLLYVKWWNTPSALIGRVKEIVNPPPPSSIQTLKNEVERILIDLLEEIHQTPQLPMVSSTQGIKHTLKY